MYPILIGVILLVSLIALVGTLYVGKDINKTIQKYEEQGDTAAAELERSRNYEKASNLKALSIIYIVTFIITTILVAIFIL
ncbi:hypothetical protein [Thalassobacillus pellis]|uniref:hypothetical protein n=1 Tax=Thalassobacillus pellis TaxID=748008 RepID=UPI001EF955DF|nr:hypothetical protein [Thalassobacillus pellis]MBM7551819.1 hypothetical protein [Thalassobacillus pellis]